jgi:hypothetical protein
MISLKPNEIFAEKNHDADMLYSRRYYRLRVHLLKDPRLIN